LTVAVKMEKLTAAQQQQIKKMSDDRLRVKLMAAWYEEDVVLGYERDDLMSLYADVLATGKPKAGPVGYDPELERERLAFEKAKWETDGKQKWRQKGLRRRKERLKQKKESVKKRPKRKRGNAVG